MQSIGSSPHRGTSRKNSTKSFIDEAISLHGEGLKSNSEFKCNSRGKIIKNHPPKRTKYIRDEDFPDVESEVKCSELVCLSTR